MLRPFKELLRSVLTMSNQTPQNFLGARWAPLLIENSPPRYRKSLALRVLSLSPHYFLDSKGRFWGPSSFVRKEASRNFSSRSQLADEIIRPCVKSTDTVVDYGCGPGYMAFHVASFAQRVIGCDISDGALACARVLNGAQNIEYMNPRQLAERHPLADLVYSVAMAQHVTDSMLGQILRLIYRILRTRGTLLMHIVVNGEGWRSELESVNDRSLRGRLRLKYGLNCFSRSPDQILGLAREAGYTDCRLLPMSELTRVDDDVAGQHLLLCHT